MQPGIWRIKRFRRRSAGDGLAPNPHQIEAVMFALKRIPQGGWLRASCVAGIHGGD